VRRAWETIGTVGLSTLIAIALVSGTAAMAADADIDAGPWIPDLIGSLGPNGALIYLIWTIGRSNGIPLTVSVRMSPEDREALDRIYRRITVVMRHLEK